jgi:hypothetical protein
MTGTATTMSAAAKNSYVINEVVLFHARTAKIGFMSWAFVMLLNFCCVAFLYFLKFYSATEQQ